MLTGRTASRAATSRSGLACAGCTARRHQQAGCGTPFNPPSPWPRLTARCATSSVDRSGQAARLAAMTPDELALYKKRSRAMRPGTPAERAQRRRDRAMRLEIARADERKPNRSPELIALDDEIRRLEARQAELQQKRKYDA